MRYSTNNILLYGWFYKLALADFGIIFESKV